jgi:hypothetical protein
VVVVERAPRLLHRVSYCHLRVRARKRVRQVGVSASALVAMFSGEDVTLLVAMAFDGAGKQSGVDVGVPRVGGMA